MRKESVMGYKIRKMICFFFGGKKDLFLKRVNIEMVGSFYKLGKKKVKKQYFIIIVRIFISLELYVY